MSGAVVRNSHAVQMSDLGKSTLTKNVHTVFNWKPPFVQVVESEAADLRDFDRVKVGLIVFDNINNVLPSPVFPERTLTLNCLGNTSILVGKVILDHVLSCLLCVR